MVNSNITERAKQGNPQAIAALLNQSLQPLGIIARVIVKPEEGRLHILVESNGIPDQIDTVPIVVQELTALELQDFPSASIYGRQKGSKDPAWNETVDLMSAPTAYVDDYADLPLADAEPGDYSEDAVSDEEESENAEPAAKGKFWAGKAPPRKTLLLAAIPLVLLLAAGGWWFFLRSPESEPPAPTPVPAKVPAPVPAATASKNPFGDAVKTATQAANQAQTAKTKAEWAAVATLWQQASDLMKAVPQNHPRYQAAVERVTAYQKNAEVAKAKAAQSP